MAIIPADPFILVDGSSYLFRAYHALPPLMTSKGQPTNAIFGVVNMLKKLLNTYAATKVVVVFDSKEKNFRHQLYTPYKANRIIMPEPLQQQIMPLHTIIKAMGFPLVVMPGIEADDVIATLARQAKRAGLFSLISTGDKDFAQLVDEKTFLVNTMTGEVFDRQKVIDKFEVSPEQIVDYLTLMGDSVDNIPGVLNVGPKTAVKWLKTYGSLKNIIENAKEISGKVGENLRAALEHLPLFEKLITIQDNLVLPYSVTDLVLQTPDEAVLQALATELEMKNLWVGVPKNPEALAPQETVQYETVLTKERFEYWLQALQNAAVFAFDTETTGLDSLSAEIVGISFAIKPYQAAYVPVAHDYEDVVTQLPRQWVLEKIKPLLEDIKIQKIIGHNLKYDQSVLLNHQISLRSIAFDTMLESYVLHSTASKHDMNTLAKRYLGYHTLTFEEVAGKGAKQLTFNQVHLEKATFYAAEDADVTLRLHEKLWSQLAALEKPKKILETIEMPLISVLSSMERRGVCIDVKRLAEQSESLGKKLKALEDEAMQLAGKSFNLNSPKQLQEILYEDLKLPVLEKTPTGQPSTAESVMQELALQYPLPKVILEYRGLSKLKLTYTDKLPLQIHPKTQRIHTSYHQAVTATGRLSSTDPNLQNIPIRSVEGRKIRSAFIAPPGYKMVAADYSQIELRIMAHLSQDKSLLEAFRLNQDIHLSTAARVFQVPLEFVTPEQRSHAKTINFGLLYGMSAFGLSKQLGITRAEAEKQIESYFHCFPGVKKFMEEIVQSAKENGYVETLWGRRLYLPDINSTNIVSRRAAERAAINAPMQGTNADIIKLAMIHLHEWIQAGHKDAYMIMQVHDELIFEIPETALAEMINGIRTLMENVVTLAVPLRVNIGIGNNWDEAH